MDFGKRGILFLFSPFIYFHPLLLDRQHGDIFRGDTKQSENYLPSRRSSKMGIKATYSIAKFEAEPDFAIKFGPNQ